jgi:putative oxidoreductase
MDLALFALHFIVGALFFAHGAQKLFGWFGGYGIGGTAGFMDSLGMRPARLHAVAAGLAETVGGVLLALGLFTPIGAAMVIAVMVTAIITVHGTKGFFTSDGGYEFNLVLIAVAFALAGVGPGAWSLDNAIDITWTGTGWALVALGAGLLGGIGAVVQGRATSASQAGRTPAATA